MEYGNFRIRPITVKEANIILEILKSYGIKILYFGVNDCLDEEKRAIADFNYSKYAIVKENDASLWIETKYYEWKYKATRYVCWLDDKVRPTISGHQAFCALQKYCYKSTYAGKYHWDLLDRYYDTKLRKYMCSASPLVWYNPKYEMTELRDVYEYDVNSAYSSVMLDRIPDVNRPYFGHTLKKDQVGFWLDDKLSMVSQPGCYAEIAFDLIELSPKQKEYLKRLYEKKETALDEFEYKEAKLAANAAIGYYQKWNPFMRSYVVNTCNKNIKSLMDEDTILCNTDAIFSLKKRDELIIGEGIGEFKEERIDRFVYRGNNYQKNWEKPKYRGVSASWFPEGWDLLKDPVPKRANPYKFDSEKMTIEKEEGHEAWRGKD